MSAPAQLQAALHELLGDARLVAETLPDTELRLWLIDAANMDRAFNPEETRRILDEPPYWCFCWASGLVLARWLAERPDWVRGKRVLDFGAGSGVAAIAAAKAGAAEVVACDLDPLALAACRANAALNGVELRYSQDFFGEADRFDLILVADVLYDRANLPLLDQFSAEAGKRWWPTPACGTSPIRCTGAWTYSMHAPGRIWQSQRSFAK